MARLKSGAGEPKKNKGKDPAKRENIPSEARIRTGAAITWGYPNQSQEGVLIKKCQLIGDPPSHKTIPKTAQGNCRTTHKIDQTNLPSNAQHGE